jgi:hypothetical protein
MNEIFSGILLTAGIKIGHSHIPVLPAITRNSFSGKSIIFTTKFRKMTEGI